jgi:hypothetical protein
MFRAAILRAVAGGATFAVLAASPPLPGALSSDGPAQARERVLYVNAYDSKTRKPIADLGPRDFVVREDDVAREVLRVTRATSTMPVAVLIDNTQAADSAISDIRRALTAFVGAIDGLGPVALITFADRPTILVDYTTASKELERGIGRVFAQPASGARLLDAISEVASGLRKRESDRAAMVVLTTEHVEFSTLHYSQVLEALRASGASLNAIVLANPAASITSDEARNRATVLDRGPRETGGIRQDVLSSLAFESQLRDVAEILKSQYRLVYARPDSLIPPERIQVSAARDGVEVQGTPARGQDVRK